VKCVACFDYNKCLCKCCYIRLYGIKKCVALTSTNVCIIVTFVFEIKKCVASTTINVCVNVA
jgi:hypothetical protein